MKNSTSKDPKQFSWEVSIETRPLSAGILGKKSSGGGGNQCKSGGGGNGKCGTSK